MKLCANCKHAMFPVGIEMMADALPKCTHPDMPIDPVYGRVVAIYCSTARSHNVLAPFDGCGYEGKLFEEAPPRPEPMPAPVLNAAAYGGTYGGTVPDEQKKSWFKRIFGA